MPTTRPGRAAVRAPDLAERDVAAERPNRLWVADLAHIATWTGVAYVCFITDAFSRRIVGWRVASHMQTQMMLEAAGMAGWRRGACLEGLTAHIYAGIHHVSIRFGEHPHHIGAVPSIESVGDSNDNALTEAVNALYKTELIRSPAQGLWRTVEAVELDTLEWLYWWNTNRIHH